MAQPAVLVFTARGPQRILSEGGSQAWKLDPDRTRRSGYVVCVQNRHNGAWGGADQPHGTAFLVGRIADVVRSPEDDSRWLIRIGAYARIALPDVWQGWRNPVRYTTLDELGLDPATLAFQPLPVDVPAVARDVEDTPRPTNAPANAMVAQPEPRPLSIAEAKRGLALTFGVAEDAIEITIRG